MMFVLFYIVKKVSSNLLLIKKFVVLYNDTDNFGERKVVLIL